MDGSVNLNISYPSVTVAGNIPSPGRNAKLNELPRAKIDGLLDDGLPSQQSNLRIMPKSEVPSNPFKDAYTSRAINNALKGVKSFPQDGTSFLNKEGLLPSKTLGYYKEFTVVSKGVTHRGVQRIVTGLNGEVYYTPDHYKSFIRIR